MPVSIGSYIERFSQGFLTGAPTSNINSGYSQAYDSIYVSKINGAVGNGYSQAYDSIYFSGITGDVIGETISLPNAGSFEQKQIIEENDLSLILTRGQWIDGSYYNDVRENAYWLYYSIIKFDSSSDTTGNIVGYNQRSATNPSTGVYYPSMIAPSIIGNYQIQWTYQVDASSFAVRKTQDFGVISWGI